MRRRASRKGDRPIDFIKRGVVIFILIFSRWIVELHLPAIQFRRGTRNHLHEALLNSASLRLTRGYSWIWRIALYDVSVKIRPLRLIQPCRRRRNFRMT